MTAPAMRGADAAEAELPSEPSSPAARRGFPNLSSVSGRIRRLAAGLLVFAGLAAGLLAGGEAQAQTSTDPFWTATMTVGVSTTGINFGYFKFGANTSDYYGSLSDDSVTRSGYPDMTIEIMDWRSATAIVSPNRIRMYRSFGAGTLNRAGDVVACIDGTKYTVSGLYVEPGAIAIGTANLGWSVGDTVELALTEVGGNCSTMPAVTLAASGVSASGAVLTIGGHTGEWWHKSTTPASMTCTAVAAGTATATLSDLTAGTSYTWQAYSDSSCATALGTAATFMTTPEPIWTATLTVAEFTDQFGYNGVAAKGSVTTRRIDHGGKHVLLHQLFHKGSNLTLRLRSTFFGSAHSDSLTGSFTLCLGSVAVAWNGATFTNKAVSGLSWSAGDMVDLSAYVGTQSCPSGAGGMPAGTVTADPVTPNGATLTVANHPSTWYHKRTAPTAGTCSTAQTGATADLTALAPGVAYTWKTYSDSGCTDANEVASVEFKTPPAQVSLGSVSFVPAQLPSLPALQVYWSVAAGATGYVVQWKSGEESFSSSANPARHAETTVSGHRIPSVSLGTEYTVRVKGTATGAADGAWSAEKTFTTPPTKVANVTVKAAKESLVLAWDETASATGYEVQWKSGAEEFSSSENPARHATTTETSYTITDLVAWRQYTVRVRASNSGGDGAWSGEGTLRASGLDQVTGVMVTAAEAGDALDVSWTAVTGAAKYVISWKQGSDSFSTANSVTVNAPATSGTIPDLTAGAEYTVVVQAADAMDRTGLRSEEATGTPSAPPAFTEVFSTIVTAADPGNGVPGYLTGTYGSATPSEFTYKETDFEIALITHTTTPGALNVGIQLQGGETAPAYADAYSLCEGGVKWAGWTGAFTADYNQNSSGSMTVGNSYRLRLVEGATCPPANPGLTAGSVTTTGATLTVYEHPMTWYRKQTAPTAGTCSAAQTGRTASLTGLTPGAAHTWKTYSDAACTNANELASVDFRTPPAQVTGLAAASAADGEALNLTWTAAAGATGYVVQWKSGQESFDATRQATAASNSHTISDLTAGTAYTVRAKATAAAEPDGAWSAEVAGTTAPATPADIEITEAKQSLALTWTASAGATGYELQWKTGSETFSSSANPARHATTTSTTYTITGLTGGTDYTVRLRATNAGGGGPWSAEGTKRAQALDQVTGVAVTAASAGGALDVSWTAVTGAAKYLIFWKQGQDSFSTTNSVTVNAPATSGAIPNLTAGTEYTVVVQAADANDRTGPRSEEATGTPTAATAPALVSNIGQTSANTTGMGNDIAIGFTTGAHATGYNVVSVGAQFNRTGGAITSENQVFALSIWTANEAGNRPGSSLYTLISPASGYDGTGEKDFTFTAPPDSTLAASTTYFLVGKCTGTCPQWSRANTNAEDNGGAAGWSIADVSLRRAGSAWFQDANEPKFRINGSASGLSPTPEMDVQGNSVSIPDGDTAPGTGDHTDFGAAGVEGGTVSRTFTIRNTGTGALTLSGNPKVAVSGDNASEFTVTAQPSSPVAATTGTTTFTVEFDPAGTGERTAKLSIANSDANENPYDFAVKGTGAVNLAASGVTPNGATLTIGGHTGAWWHKSTTPSSTQCDAVMAGTATATLSGLTARTSYTWQAYSDNTCATALGSPATFMTPASLTVDTSSITPTGATLVFENHPAVWSLQQTAPTTKGCVSDNTFNGFVRTTPGASHTFKVYGTRNCSGTALAEVTFRTPPEQVAGLTAAAASDGNALDLTWTAATGATGYEVQWKSDEESFSSSANPARHATASSNSHTISDLTAGTEYTVRVKATAAADPDGEWSEEATGTPTAPATPPEMDVQGNSVSIPDGDTSPAAGDHTDFGAAGVSGGKVSRTFTIKNTGTGALTLSGTPKVAVSGTNADDFEVKTQPSSPVAATTGTTTFTVEFDPDGTGERTAMLSIANDDADENPYNFDIKGTGAKNLSVNTNRIRVTSLARLTIGGHTGNWWYKQTSPAVAGACTAGDTSTAYTSHLFGLSVSTQYAYRAYSDSACTTAITEAATFTTKAAPAAVPGLAVTEGATSLTIGWTDEGLDDIVQVYWKSTGEEFTGDGFGFPTVPGDTSRSGFAFANSGSSIVIPSAGFPGTLTAGTEYTVQLQFRPAGEDPHFRYLSEVKGTPGVRLESSGETESGATLTIKAHTGQWWYKSTMPSSTTCTSVAAGTSAATLAGLDAGTSYTYQAYSENTCATALGAAVTFMTAASTAPGVEAGSVTTDGATLTVENHPSTWRHKQTAPSAGTCSTAQTGTTADLTGLTHGTTYTWKTYSDATCTDANELASVEFSTKLNWTATLTVGNDSDATTVRGYKPAKPGDNAGALSPGTIAYRGATYTIANFLHDSGAGNEFKVSGTPAVSTNFKLCLDGAAAGTKPFLDGTAQTFTGAADWVLDQTVKAALVESAADCPAGAGTKPAAGVTASTVTPTEAILTVVGHPLIWRARYTSPSEGPCLQSQEELSPGTSYTVKTYSTGDCSGTALAETSFRTPPAQVTGLAAAAASDGNALDLTWTAAAGATGYVVQWKSDSESFGTARQATASSNSHTISGLKAGTEYTVRAKATAAADPDGAWSADATGTPTAAAGDATGAPSISGTAQEGMDLTAAAGDIADGDGLTSPTYEWQWIRVDGNNETDISGATASTYRVASGDVGKQLKVKASFRDDLNNPESRTSAATATVTAATAPSLSVGASVTRTGATLTIAAHSGQWWYKSTTPASNTCTSVAAGTTTATLAGLTAGTSYTWQAYSDSACATALGSPVTFMTQAAALNWTATLTIGNDSGASSRGYLPAAAGGNPGVLTPNTISYGGAAYTVAALRYSSAAGSRFEVSGTPAVAANFKLCLDGAAAGTKPFLNGDEQTFTVSSGATDWVLDQTVKVALVESSASCPAGAGAKPAAALDVSGITSTSATLTVESHRLTWRLRRTAPTLSGCGIAAGPQSGLTPDTSHTYKTYSSDNCSGAALAEVTFRTLAAPTGSAPEIEVRGDDLSIADGDVTPSAADHTDFGSVAAASGSVTRTFTILNTGTGNLTLPGSAPVTLGSTSHFTVTAQPASPVAPGESTTFRIRFDPSATDTLGTTVSIANDDADENPFDFSIRGVGTAGGTGTGGGGGGGSDPSPDASLRALLLGTDGTLELDPPFSPGVTEYTAAVPHTVAELRFAPAPNQEDATIRVGAPGDLRDVTGDGLAVALKTGENVVSIVVTAEDGTTMRTYTVTVTRAPRPSAPAFAAETAVFSVDENHAEGALLGVLAAADADGDALTYSLSGADAAAFVIGAGGALRVAEGVALDYESKSEYAFAAEVSDGEDAEGMAEDPPVADDAVAVTVAVRNVEEPPGAPENLAVTARGQSSLTLRWTAPADAGAQPVTDYDLRWFAGAADPADEADWVEPGEPGGHDHAGAATETTIAGLAPGAAYRVQARAAGDGLGPWSASAAASTLDRPSAPEPPGAPLNLAVSAAGGDRIEADWSPPADAGGGLEGYEVQYRAAGGTRWTDHPHDGAATSAVIGGLSPVTVYAVRVRALGAGESASEWVTAEGRTAVAAPAASGALPNLTLVAGTPAVTVDASGAFAGENLTFAFASSDAGVASFAGFPSAAAALLQAVSAGRATITVTASNPGGQASLSFAVTVSAVTGEEAEALGQSFDGATRTLLSGVTGVVGARMAQSDSAAPSLASFTRDDAWSALAGLAGLPAGGAGANAAEDPAAGFIAPGSFRTMTGRGYGAAHGRGTARAGAAAMGGGPAIGGGPAMGGGMPPGGPQSGAAAPRGRPSLNPGGLWNRSFAYSLGAPASGGGQGASGAASAPRWTVWGAGDVQNFSGGQGEQRFDGRSRTAYLGADRRLGARWLGGVAVSRGIGEADYAFGGAAAGGGKLKTEMNAVYPYVQGALAGGTEVWAMVGAGRGETTNERSLQQGDVHAGDLSMRLAAAGLRRSLRSWRTVQLSVLADAGAATLEVEGEDSLAALESTAHRGRLGLELAGRSAFSPYLRLNARYDGGGDMSEGGYEAELGLRRAGARFDFDLRGRYMALAGDANYEETGATATLRLKARPDGTGLTASLTPSWGRPGASDFVWNQGPMPSMYPGAAADPALVWRADLGYGVVSWLLRGTVTPTLGYARGAFGGEALQLGADYAANPKWLRRDLTVGFGLQQQQTPEGPAWAGGFEVTIRW